MDDVRNSLLRYLPSPIDLGSTNWLAAAQGSYRNPLMTPPGPPTSAAPSPLPWHGGWAQPLEDRGAGGLADLPPSEGIYPGVLHDPRSQAARIGSRGWQQFVMPQTSYSASMTPSISGHVGLNYNPFDDRRRPGGTARLRFDF